MATTVDPQTLLMQANCYACYADNGYMLQLMKLALLSQISTGSGVPASTCENLSGAASPLNNVTPDFVGQVYVQSNGEIWQAGNLLNSSWVVIGGPMQIFLDYYPSTPPTDPTKPALTYNTGGSTLYQWDVNSQTWV
jgi:hypothetical protein